MSSNLLSVWVSRVVEICALTSSKVQPAICRAPMHAVICLQIAQVPSVDESTGAVTGAMEVSVIDTGLGIPEEFRDRSVPAHSAHHTQPKPTLHLSLLPQQYAGKQYR